MRALKMRTIVTSHQNLTMTNWEQSLKLIFLQLHEKLPKKNVDHSMVIGHLKQIGKVKKLNKWMPSWADQKSKKSSFWSIVFSYSTQQRTISQLDCDVWWKVDFIQQLMITSSVAGLRRSPKALSQSQTWTKKKKRKVMVTVWWSAAHVIHYSFLNPGKTITPEKYAQWIDKMPPKLQCLQPALINNMTPILPHDDAQLHVAQQMLQKLNALGCEVLPHLPYSPDLLPTDYHFFQHLDNFLQGKCFHKPQEAENTFYEFVDSKSMDFYATGINKLISHWQEWVYCNGSYFD